MNKTMQMLNGTAMVLGLVGACCFTGCAPADAADEDGPVGDVQQAEIDPGLKVWDQMKMTFGDPANTPFATMYIFNRALGSYQTGTEYWFVNLNSVSLLGTYGLNMVSTASSSGTAPPDPAYSSEQSFSMPNLSAWGDGVDDGSGEWRHALQRTESASVAADDRVDGGDEHPVVSGHRQHGDAAQPHGEWVVHPWRVERVGALRIQGIQHRPDAVGGRSRRRAGLPVGATRRRWAADS